MGRLLPPKLRVSKIVEHQLVPSANVVLKGYLHLHGFGPFLTSDSALHHHGRSTFSPTARRYRMVPAEQAIQRIVGSQRRLQDIPRADTRPQHTNFRQDQMLTLSTGCGELERKLRCQRTIRLLRMVPEALLLVGDQEQLLRIGALRGRLEDCEPWSAMTVIRARSACGGVTVARVPYSTHNARAGESSPC